MVKPVRTRETLPECEYEGQFFRGSNFPVSASGAVSIPEAIWGVLSSTKITVRERFSRISTMSGEDHPVRRQGEMNVGFFLGYCQAIFPVFRSIALCQLSS